jgi:putative SOS response-associated peptidase YedK
MCGRLDQNDIDRVLNDFSWAEEVVRRSHAELLFNAAPGTMRPILHIEDGKLVVDDRWWMYKAAGSTATARPTPNARLDKIAGRYWSRLLQAGRIIVPANGWYEWTGDKPYKQPWHIHSADGELLYLVALTAWGTPGDDKNATGFAIVTDDAEGGMIDVHDRRPVVFTASDAAAWMDPELSREQAAELARSVALGPDRFAWYQVSKAVGNSRNQGPELAAPIPDLFSD